MTIENQKEGGSKMGKQINIKLSSDAAKELEQLKIDLKLPSIAEVIRSSIALTKFLELQKKDGKDIVLKDKITKEEKTIIMVR